MQMEKKEPATTKPSSICERLQKAFHSRPAFQPLRRLTVRPQDAETAAPTAATGGLPTPVPPPPTPVPVKTGEGKYDKPQKGQQVPVSSDGITAAASAAEKTTVTAAAGMPVPAPSPAVAAAPQAAEVKGADNVQHTKRKFRIGFRERKTLSSK